MHHDSLFSFLFAQLLQTLLFDVEDCQEVLGLLVHTQLCQLHKLKTLAVVSLKVGLLAPMQEVVEVDLLVGLQCFQLLVIVQPGFGIYRGPGCKKLLLLFIIFLLRLRFSHLFLRLLPSDGGSGLSFGIYHYIICHANLFLFPGVSLHFWSGFFFSRHRIVKNLDVFGCHMISACPKCETLSQTSVRLYPKNSISSLTKTIRTSGLY